MQTRLGVDAVKTLDSNLRLSRTDGDIQLVTYHKPSDPLSAGDQGSQAAQIAKDLLNLADIRILLGQDPKVADELGGLLGLTPIQQQHRHRLGHAGEGPRPVDGRRPRLQGADPPHPPRAAAHLHQRGHHRRPAMRPRHDLAARAAADPAARLPGPAPHRRRRRHPPTAATCPPVPDRAPIARSRRWRARHRGRCAWRTPTSTPA